MCITICNKLVLPCNTDKCIVKSQILRHFFSVLFINLTRSDPLIKKRAPLASCSCADADSARISLACSTCPLRRARVNNDRSAQSNNRTG